MLSTDWVWESPVVVWRQTTCSERERREHVLEGLPHAKSLPLQARGYTRQVPAGAVCLCKERRPCEVWDLANPRNFSKSEMQNTAEMLL